MKNNLAGNMSGNSRTEAIAKKISKQEILTPVNINNKLNPASFVNFTHRCTARLFAFTLALGTIASPALSADNSQQEEVKSKSYSIYAETGYRKDNLNWKISDFLIWLYDPNASTWYGFPGASKLSWKNLEIFDTKIGGDLPLVKIKKGDLFLSGSIAHGIIFDGKNQDSDFIGSNEVEFSRSNNKSESGSTQDYSLALNYKYPLDKVHFLKSKRDSYSITPSIGYSINKQNLRMSDGTQTIDYFNPSNEGRAISGLNSSYDTTWKGAFLGLTLNSQIGKKHNIEVSGKYHFTDYYAQADWNLRSDFAHPKSFEHEADGNGKTLALKYSYKPGENISYNIAFDYKKFTTDAGTDTTFFSNGMASTTRLDEVNWDSRSLKVGVKYEY